MVNDSSEVIVVIGVGNEVYEMKLSSDHTLGYVREAALVKFGYTNGEYVDWRIYDKIGTFIDASKKIKDAHIFMEIGSTCYKLYLGLSVGVRPIKEDNHISSKTVDCIATTIEKSMQLKGYEIELVDYVQHTEEHVTDLTKFIKAYIETNLIPVSVIVRGPRIFIKSDAVPSSKKDPIVMTCSSAAAICKDSRINLQESSLLTSTNQPGTLFNLDYIEHTNI